MTFHALMVRGCGPKGAKAKQLRALLSALGTTSAPALSKSPSIAHVELTIEEC